MTLHIKHKDIKYRYENFGGIISSDSPPFLAFVDRQYMRELDLDESPLWKTGDESIGILSGPTEVHFSITNKCSVGCPHCYMDGGQPDENALNTEKIKEVLDVLSDMGVFHIAMGGGEALEHPDLFELAAYARDKGLVPNLTTSGYGLTSELANRMAVFGQVNVSIDGIGDNQPLYRHADHFASANQALEFLLKYGVSSGINCVLGKRNFDGLEALFQYANSKKVNEIEFLRFKPSGRGKELYLQEKTTHEQNKQLIPELARLSKEYSITAKIDCSFVPMYCYHTPPMELLEQFATYGCEAGNILLGVRSNGKVSGCSFLDNVDISVFDLPHLFGKVKDNPFQELRTWVERAPEPCRSCTYLSICKGGCHSVSQFMTGHYDNPDPDCPIVVEQKKG